MFVDNLERGVLYISVPEEEFTHKNVIFFCLAFGNKGDLHLETAVGLEPCSDGSKV